LKTSGLPAAALAAAAFAIAALTACSQEKTAADAGADAAIPDGGAADAGCSFAPYCEKGGDRILFRCENGEVKKSDCMSELGMLCQDGACIDPAKWGSPVWSKCPNAAGGTAETLKAKAEFYDRIVRNIHINPVSHISHHITLKDGRDIKTATGQDDVQSWNTGENDGLWSGHYLASQAFRYAVTKSPEALENVKTLIFGHLDLSGVTGKPGLLARQFDPPNTRGMGCPAETPDAYLWDPAAPSHTYGNKWRRIEADGCIKVWDKSKSDWAKLAFCADKKYSGYCFLDNVSVDSIIGTMYAFSAAWMLVDDPGVKAYTAGFLYDAVKLLTDGGMKFYDWDDKVTYFGRVYPGSLQEFPGFSAWMGLSYVKSGAVTSGDAALAKIYKNCLVAGKEGGDCSKIPPDGSYLNYLRAHGLYNAKDAYGCKNNYNNFNMTFMGIHTLIWMERDTETRAAMQGPLEDSVMGIGSERDMWEQKNSFFNFIYASQKKLGLDSSGPAYQAVEDAVCSLKQFPTTKVYYTHVNNEDKYPFDCIGRLNGRNTNVPIPLNERDLWVFTWSADPYQLKQFGPETKRVEIPADYLLPYWMGRYYGFISEDM
jgi:hypothetical protein